MMHEIKKKMNPDDTRPTYEEMFANMNLRLNFHLVHTMVFDYFSHTAITAITRRCTNGYMSAFINISAKDFVTSVLSCPVSEILQVS